MRRQSLACRAFLCAPLLIWVLPSFSSPPNIVLILADDLGWGDVQANNPEGKIKTPVMNRLAEDGLRFTDAHSGSAVCSPTRYGLLTGRYSWRSPLKRGVLGGLSPRLIEEGRMTLASLLQAHGYHTCCVGKWHLGMDWVVHPGKSVSLLSVEMPIQVHNVDYRQPITNGPTSVGFDSFFGIAASLDMVPYTFIENDHVHADPSVDRDFPMVHGEEESRRTRLGPGAPDFDDSLILPTLVDRAKSFIVKSASERDKPFFLYLPLASPHTPIAPTAEWRGKSGLNAYADFVMQTDAAVGEVLASLEEHGCSANTLVILTSDNGCAPYAGVEYLVSKDHHPSGPYRGYKADLYEGGHRVPFLVRWPDVVKPGGTTDSLTCLNDVFATVADILDIDLPPDAGEDSVSFLPTLKGDAKGARSTLISQSVNGTLAIRDGDWKLLLCPGSGGWSYPRPGKDSTNGMPAIQLYNLREDPAESRNRQEEQPAVVKRLKSLLGKHVEEGRSTPGPAQRNTTPVEIDLLMKG